MDWESWLKQAAAPPSDHEDAKRIKTEAEIRAALGASDRLRGRPYTVYAKGSYANNTNVRLNYDVDVAVEYSGFFYFDIVGDLQDVPPSDIGISIPAHDPYTRDQFKADIRGALVDAFGSTAITDGNIAYRVRERQTTLPADVVPSWEYRRYFQSTVMGPVYHEGARVFPAEGGYKDNFPKVQLTNGVNKNKATGLRYKRMVRGLKKLQTRLVEAGELNEELPSYLTECLVYNVPDDLLNSATYVSDMRAVLATIFNGTLPDGASNDWVEVHGLHYLMRGGNSWTTQEIHEMASAAWNHMGLV